MDDFMELEPEMVMALREMFKANADPMVRELIERREKRDFYISSENHDTRLDNELLNKFKYDSIIKLYDDGIKPEDIKEILEINLEDILQIIDGHRNN